MEQWITANWFELASTVGTVGIVGGFWIGIISLRSETKTRRIANLLTITTNNLEIRKEFHRYQVELVRVQDMSADVAKQPVTPLEESFVYMVIFQMVSTYEALKDDLLVKQEGLRLDAKNFFSLPVPKAVWAKAKLLQNQGFAAFIDSSLES